MDALPALGKHHGFASIHSHSLHLLPLKPSQHKISYSIKLSRCTFKPSFEGVARNGCSNESWRTAYASQRELFLKSLVQKRGVKKYLSLDGKSLKKPPNAWSHRDYTCEACGKTFTQYHTLHTHKKILLPKLRNRKSAKRRMFKCWQRVSKTTLRSHAKRTGVQDREGN